MKILLFAVFQLMVIFIVSGQSALYEFKGVKVKQGDSWVKQVSGVPPVYRDTTLFLETVTSKMKYPVQAMRMGIEGDADCTIELDESGEVVKYVITKDIGEGTRESIATVIKALPSKWIPAVVDGKNVASKVSILFNFHLGMLDSYTPKDQCYITYLVMATGSGRWITLDARLKAAKPKKLK